MFPVVRPTAFPTSHNKNMSPQKYNREGIQSLRRVLYTSVRDANLLSYFLP
jgi:hypothetical protein